MIPLSGRWVALFFLVIAVSCQACASDGKKPPEPFEYYYHLDGFAVWACNQDVPISFSRNRTPFDLIEYKAIRAHELSHERMMLGFGSCGAWREWMEADPANRMLFEAVAYCVMARQLVHDGIPVDSAMDQVVRRFQGGFDDLSGAEARSQILGVCS